jgi:hypothetical protein
VGGWVGGRGMGAWGVDSGAWGVLGMGSEREGEGERIPWLRLTTCPGGSARCAPGSLRYYICH